MRIDKNYTFYLGGYDAEMYEIRKILEHHNLSFFDKNLSWGAKASDYKDNLNSVKKTEIPVLIELTIDMPIPLNTIIIDHHNENESKPSSVEQIAVLLGIELNRWQKLIAANDKGYIPAMKNICASTIEIKEIREFDRKAQGVTEEDEKLAEESIIKNKKEQNGITIIKSLTEKFSPIADRMYGKTSNLLVYTDEALTYYGEKKKQILNKFNNLVDGGKAYYGGKDFGFFGLAKGKVTNDEVIEIKNEILEMKPEMNEKLYSHHIFIFPFKWRKWKVDDQSLLHDKFDVEFFLEELKSSNWEPKPFDLNLPDRYNEYNYFYDYVSEILYDLSDELTTNDIDKNLINHFEYNLKNDTYYNIKLCGIEEPLTLIIDSILLNIYSTGTAVLSFHLRNHKYDSKEDILKINKYGRRLFVPFFDLQPDSIYTGKNDKTNVDRILYATKKNEIPDAIWIGNKELEKDDKHCYEDFEKYKDKTNYKHKPFLLPRFIDGLFPDNFFLSAEQNGYLNYTQKTKDTRFKIHLSPVLDDRMHVVCWYGNTDLVNQLNKIKECNDLDLGSHYVNDNRECKKHYSYETDEWWYSYIFVDSPTPMHTDKFIKQKLLHENTYSRWVEWSTLFGLSRFSFVMLTSSFSALETNEVTFLVRHLQSLYYKMAELCLLQRATVLSFSNEITHVSNLLKNDDDEKITKKISELYKHYILFVNKIYFREITAQEQGIEIYDMMQKIMRIPSDVKDLDNEMEELNHFASMTAEKNKNEEAIKLTKVATIFLIPTLMASLLGMNVLPDFVNIPTILLSTKPVWPFWISLIIIFIITYVTIKFNLIRFILNWFPKQNKNKKK